MRRILIALAFLVLVAFPSTVFATDLVVIKTLLTKGPFKVGDTIQYLIVIRNNKIPNAIASPVVLFDRYPAGLMRMDIQGDFAGAECVLI